MSNISRMRGQGTREQSQRLARGNKHRIRNGLALLSGGTLVASLLSLVLAFPAHASTSVPSPTAGGWTLFGNAAVVSSTVSGVLAVDDTDSAGYEAGLAYYPTAVSGVGVTATFDALLENGTGADGLTFALLNAASGPPVLGIYGGGLGFSGNTGIAVALDTYKNPQNPSANFVGLATGAGPQPDTLTWGATSTNVPKLHDSSLPDPGSCHDHRGGSHGQRQWRSRSCRGSGQSPTAHTWLSPGATADSPTFTLSRT